MKDTSESSDIGGINEEILNKFDELQNVYEYRAVNQTATELSTYHLPESIMRFVDKTDLNLLKKSIGDIGNKVPNSMERHCALEIFLVTKWCRKMLTKVMVFTNSQLPQHKIKKYRSINPIKVKEKCVICNINISTPGILNKDMLKSIAREEFISIYSNIGLFNMPEEEYISNCVKAVENVILLADLPKNNRSSGGDMKIIKDRFHKLYQYLSKNEIEDVQLFISVKNDYKESLTGPDVDFIMKSAKQKEVIEEKIRNMMWKDALIDYCYKDLIGGNIPPSQIWIDNIAAMLEDELVIHHCHYSGYIYGYAHKNCNSKLKIQNEIPVKVYAHNASNFDLLFLV